jgi:hypothetical protein
MWSGVHACRRVRLRLVLPFWCKAVCWSNHDGRAEQSFWQLVLLSTFNGKANAYSHLVKPMKHRLQCLLRGRRELVDINVHLDVSIAADQPTSVSDQHGLGVVRGDEGREPKLVNVVASNSDLRPIKRKPQTYIYTHMYVEKNMGMIVLIV